MSQLFNLIIAGVLVDPVYLTCESCLSRICQVRLPLCQQEIGYFILDFHYSRLVYEPH